MSTVNGVRKGMCLALAALFLVPCGSAAAAESAAAPNHTVAASDLYSAMSAQDVRDAAAREKILKLLGHADVVRVAEHAGVDLARVRSAASVLSGESLLVVAHQAQRVNDALAGGSTVVVTSTALIIGLLVVIILLVA